MLEVKTERFTRQDPRREIIPRSVSREVRAHPRAREGKGGSRGEPRSPPPKHECRLGAPDGGCGGRQGGRARAPLEAGGPPPIPPPPGPAPRRGPKPLAGRARRPRGPAAGDGALGDRRKYRATPRLRRSGKTQRCRGLPRSAGSPGTRPGSFGGSRAPGGGRELTRRRASSVAAIARTGRQLAAASPRPRSASGAAAGRLPGARGGAAAVTGRGRLGGAEAGPSAGLRFPRSGRVLQERPPRSELGSRGGRATGQSGD